MQWKSLNVITVNVVSHYCDLYERTSVHSFHSVYMVKMILSRSNHAMWMKRKISSFTIYIQKMFHRSLLLCIYYLVLKSYVKNIRSFTILAASRNRRTVETVGIMCSFAYDAQTFFFFFFYFLIHDWFNNHLKHLGRETRLCVLIRPVWLWHPTI